MASSETPYAILVTASPMKGHDVGLLDELEADQNLSVMDRIFADPKVDEEFKEELVVALIHPKFATTSILHSLKSRGFNMGETTLRRYRAQLSELVLSMVKENTGD